MINTETVNWADLGKVYFYTYVPNLSTLMIIIKCVNDEFTSGDMHICDILSNFNKNWLIEIERISSAKTSNRGYIQRCPVHFSFFDTFDSDTFCQTGKQLIF